MNLEDLEPYLYGLDTPEGRFEGLPIIDDKGQRLFFRPSPPQQMAWDMMKARQQEDPDSPVRVVVLKNRQVGFSTFFMILMVAYCHRYAHRESYIVAQLDKTAKVLHERASKCWEALYHRTLKKGTIKSIIFPHGDDSTSFLRTDTANSLKGGRGPTAHSLHLTEASRYPPDSIGTFASAVSWNPDTMILVETTANGKTGQGADYYHLWMKAMEGRNGYLPIFIPWTMDPKCRVKVAKDFTLLDDEEERLVHELGLSYEQVAWRRLKIEGEFSGNIGMFSQENPLTPDEGFISSGSPIFYFKELEIIRKTIHAPLSEGYFEIEPSSANYLKYVPKKGGYLKLWEKPDPDCRYYLGADAAKCEDEEEDFAAAVLWNGTETGVAARIATHLPPPAFAFVLNLLGRWYMNAMLIVELTGGWGNHVQQVLKDEWAYPNLYRWKGKNDRVKHGISNSYGWETNSRTRNDMISVFKGAVREEDLVINDESLLIQMENSEQEFGMRWDVTKGHDDILMAAIIGWMARFHYPPPVTGVRRKKIIEDERPPDVPGYGALVPDPAYSMMDKHWEVLQKRIRSSEKRLRKMGGGGTVGPLRKKFI